MKNEYKKADYIFVNGKVITVNPFDDIASAVVVTDNKITYVGSSEEAMNYAVPETEVYDMSGKTMTPGFIDAHCHTAFTGLIKCAFVDISPAVAPTTDALLTIVENHMKHVEPGKWVVFFGYDEIRMEDHRHPRLDEIDRLTPNNPVLIGRCDGHTGVYNSKAMEVCNINKGTISKYNSNEVQMTNGELNGLFSDRAYYDMWNFIEVNPDAVIRGLQAESDYNVRVGVTSVHDAGGYGKITNYGYKNAIEKGLFKLRATPMPFSLLGQDSYMKDIDHYSSLGFGTYIGNDRLKFGLMKVMIDGGSSLPSCAMKEPYSHKPDDYGTLAMSPEMVDKIVLDLHKTGHQLAAHAVGDRAVEIWLNAIEKAQKAFPREDCRHRIEHGCVMNDELIARVKALGVIPIPNPRFIHLNGDRYITFFGDRVNSVFPMNSYLQAGIPCAIGTDNPIIDENPLLGISSAITRKSSTGVEVGSGQKISILDAIRMYTYNGAYATFDEDKLGSIEAGKLADLVIFDGDLLNSNPEELEKMECILTMVDGEIVYKR